MKNDQVTVSYDATVLDENAVLEIIRKQGFKADIVKKQRTSTDHPKQVSITGLPDTIKAHFAKAQEEGKLVLLDFTGPG